MSVPDPFPGRLFEHALSGLRKRFPSGDLEYHTTNGDVFTTLPLKGCKEFRAALMWQQAKYPAFAELSDDTFDYLKESRFPPDWPPSKYL